MNDTPLLDRVLAAKRGAEIIPAPALDHRAAKSRALAVLAGGDPLIAAKPAFDAFAARNLALVNGGTDEVRSALADQVVLLEAVVSSYTIAAAQEKSTERRRTLQGVAIRASATLTATLLALHRVTEDQRNGAALPA